MAALAVVETPSGKDALAEGLLDLLKPAVQQLDLHVHSVRYYFIGFVSYACYVFKIRYSIC